MTFSTCFSNSLLAEAALQMEIYIIHNYGTKQMQKQIMLEYTLSMRGNTSFLSVVCSHLVCILYTHNRNEVMFPGEQTTDDKFYNPKGCGNH